MEHNFGEKKKEKIKGVEYDVWQTPKYVESRNKAIELIESEQYKGVLKDGDFWVLMNKISENTIAYTGLIITHNACIKINDILPQEKKFQPNCFMYRTEEYANGLLGVYADDEIFEFGEVSPKNCKNDYPYAMVLKRCFDRVVLKKSGIAQWGIYSDSEADEFKEKYEKEEVFDAPLNNVKDLADEFRKIYTEEEQTRLLNGLHITRAEDMGTVNLEKYINFKKYGSKLQNDTSVCYLCGKYMGKGDKHHIFNGAKRDMAEEDGMYVYVHRVCHSFIHEHPMTMRTLKMRGQRKWEEIYGDRDAFIKRYGKSYL